MTESRGEVLERLLTTVFNTLREAEELTESKIDLEFMLTIVGSYITAKEEDKLEEDHKSPSVIFDERIFPIVDNSDFRMEAIEDGE